LNIYCSQSECRGKVTFAEGDVKQKKPAENLRANAVLIFDYSNPLIAGSVFKAKADFSFKVPKIDQSQKISLNVEKIAATFTNPPDDCSYDVTEFPVITNNNLTITRSGENSLTYSGNLTFYSRFSVKCGEDPPTISTIPAGGQPGGLLMTELKAGATATIRHDSRMNIGESKWTETVTLLSVNYEETEDDPLNVGDKLEEGDVIETGPDGRIEITLGDKSTIRIGPNSRVTMSGFACTRAQENESRITISPGSIWSKVSTVLGGKAKFEVRTGSGVSGVRGTEFVVEEKIDTVLKGNPKNVDLKDYTLNSDCNCYTKSTTTLSVIEGVVEFSRNLGELAELKKEMNEMSSEIEEELKAMDNEEEDENEIGDKENTKKMLTAMKKQIENNKATENPKNTPILVYKGQRSVIIGKSEPTSPSSYVEDKNAWYLQFKTK
jgi:hypothetical protein